METSSIGLFKGFPLCKIGSIRWAFNFSAWSPTKDQWNMAAQCIQKEEKDRIISFVYRKDAKASMAGRLLLRKLVVEKLGRANNTFTLGRTNNNKPYLIDAPELSFNVSHHGNFAVLAAEDNCHVGIDVMNIQYSGGKSVPDFFRTMKRQFTNAEWRTIMSGENERQQVFLFFRHWCLKESYVKALGVGIGFSLQRLSFHVTDTQLYKEKFTRSTLLYVDGCLLTNWEFEETMLDDNHCVAVSMGPAINKEVCGSMKDTPYLMWKFEDLIHGLIPINPTEDEYWNKYEIKDEKP